MFQKKLWSSKNIDPQHPCTSWQELSKYTFGLSPLQMKSFEKAINSIDAIYRDSIVEVDVITKTQTKNVWIPRGTDVILVFILFGILLLLASVALDQKEKEKKHLKKN